MRTITRVFEEVATKRIHKWVDENGKKRQETKKFYQTINPFNKNKKGEIKSRQEIWKEINEEADKWLKSKRPVHVRREGDE